MRNFYLGTEEAARLLRLEYREVTEPMAGFILTVSKPGVVKVLSTGAKLYKLSEPWQGCWYMVGSYAYNSADFYDLWPDYARPVSYLLVNGTKETLLPRKQVGPVELLLSRQHNFMAHMDTRLAVIILPDGYPISSKQPVWTLRSIRFPRCPSTLN